MKITVVRRWKESYQGAVRTYAEMSNGMIRRVGSERAARKAAGLSGRQWRKSKRSVAR